MFEFIGVPLGWLMKLIYNLVKNYGLTLVLFTVFIRMIQIPLNVKQQKGLAKNMQFQPKLEKLKQKYKNNKEKYQQEMMKLQEEEGYNPMASCLPSIITMVVLFGIIDVVYKPLKHLLGLSAETIEKATEALKEAGMKISSGTEISIINIIKGQNKEYKPDMFNKIFSADTIEKIKTFDMNFFGLNLGQTPHWGFNLTILIPILSGLTSLLTSFITIRNQKKMGMQQQGGGAMNVMMYVMPIFSVFIAFGFPLGIGLYWTVGNVCMLLINLVLYRIYTPEKMKELAEIESKNNKKKKKKPSKYRQAMMAAMTDKNGTDSSSAEKEKIVIDGKEVKENNLTDSQRIALARKRMAEKYGDDA